MMRQNYNPILYYPIDQVINNNNLQTNNYLNNYQVNPYVNQIIQNQIKQKEIQTIIKPKNSIVYYNKNNAIDYKNKSNIINEIYAGYGINIAIDNNINTCNKICKLSYVINNIAYYGTGFFVLLYNSFKCILTNYHIISKDLINNFIEIEIYNKNKVKILLDKNRYIKFYDDLDVTIIELKETDEIIKNIDF